MEKQYLISQEPLKRLSEAIQFRTISRSEYTDMDFDRFEEYIKFIEQAFPLFYEKCEAERVNTYGLLYRWPGSDAAKKPILLMAHYDVVPAEENGWKHPPFSGAISDGYVWGRGTLDVKAQMIAHLEAAEELMREGFTPEGDIYFAYGQDEEVGGGQGAQVIAELLKERNVHLAGVLDEGGIVISGAIKGVKSPMALIGVAEKGSANFEITARSTGGHSSMPPKTTALGQVAEVIRRIEQNPMPARLTEPVMVMLQSASKEMKFGVRLIVNNTWLLGGFLEKILSAKPETNAMIRTTFAATLASAGQARNVLPPDATVNINSRLLIGDTAEKVRAHLQKLAGDIPVEISIAGCREASLVSPASGAFYECLTETIGKFYPEAIITPYLCMGGTDSRKFEIICENIYRFGPIHLNNEEKNTIHSINERISFENYERMIRFFIALIRIC